jgi:hypothetical protein
VILRPFALVARKTRLSPFAACRFLAALMPLRDPATAFGANSTFPRRSPCCLAHLAPLSSRLFGVWRSLVAHSLGV